MRVASDIRIREDLAGESYISLYDDDNDEMASISLRDLALALKPYLDQLDT